MKNILVLGVYCCNKEKCCSIGMFHYYCCGIHGLEVIKRCSQVWDFACLEQLIVEEI